MTQAGSAADQAASEQAAAEGAPAPETPAPAPQASAAAAAELAAAQAKIAELEKKASDMRDQALRALAEADNVRKRGERERQDMAKFAVSSFARDLLTVADNLRRALSAISPEACEKSPELKNILTGVEATERELLRVFLNNGIRKIESLNEKFDANLHEVLFEVEMPGKPPGTIVQEIDSGYFIHERLLRPARVGVSKGGEASAGPGATVDKEV
jgi:molecular chaperone GrpE